MDPLLSWSRGSGDVGLISMAAEREVWSLSRFSEARERMALPTVLPAFFLWTLNLGVAVAVEAPHCS